MKLNRLEKALMNNPVRALVQRRYEAALMERLGGRAEGQRVLEIGCGRGVGTEIIFERFGARQVDAIDLDSDMIEQARRRLSNYSPDQLRLLVGDVAAINADDATYDAVFDFGIVHHVPDWQQAVSEISRVLRPGGRFFFEEVTKQALDRWFYRTFLDHPTKNRFTAKQFIAELESQGISVGSNQLEWFLGDFIVGAGRRLHQQPEGEMDHAEANQET
ncbi:MAG: class I SAM-dependent methyltransferase [Pyrinomonadaceae bacterium]